MSRRFICLDCGREFDEPRMVQESRGEFWGAPCFETMAYCPYCMGDFEENKEVEKSEWWVSAHTATGELFGASIDAQDVDEMFELFYEKYPDCDVADYGRYDDEG